PAKYPDLTHSKRQRWRERRTRTNKCSAECTRWRRDFLESESSSRGYQDSLPVSFVANRASLPKDCDMDLNRIFRAIGPLVLAWFQLTDIPAEAADVKAEKVPRFSDYRLVDSELKIMGIDSDPTESFLSLQLDSAGRLFAGGREALFVYEPAKDGLYRARQ